MLGIAARNSIMNETGATSGPIISRMQPAPTRTRTLSTASDPLHREPRRRRLPRATGGSPPPGDPGNASAMPAADDAVILPYRSAQAKRGAATEPHSRL